MTERQQLCKTQAHTLTITRRLILNVSPGLSHFGSVAKSERSLQNNFCVGTLACLCWQLHIPTCHLSLTCFPKCFHRVMPLITCLVCDTLSAQTNVILEKPSGEWGQYRIATQKVWAFSFNPLSKSAFQILPVAGLSEVFIKYGRGMFRLDKWILIGRTKRPWNSKTLTVNLIKRSVSD